MARILTLLLLLTALVSACADGTSSPDADVASAPSASADAFAFSGTTVQGASVEGGDYAGEDLMLWFWAPW